MCYAQETSSDISFLFFFVEKIEKWKKRKKTEKEKKEKEKEFHFVTPRAQTVVLRQIFLILILLILFFNYFKTKFVIFLFP